MMKDARWYSALNVVAHVQTDIEAGKVPKKVEEMWAASVMLTGMQEIQGRQYWLQPVSDSEGSPDIRTITRIDRMDDRAPDYVFQDLEIVSYTASSASAGESLPAFLLRTKLAPQKAYDELTTILIWTKVAPPSSTATEWRAALAGINTHVPNVMLLGHAHPTEPLYSLVQVYPDPLPMIAGFNLPNLLKKQGYTGVITLMRGTKKKEVRREGEDHCPFEKLGVKCLFIK
ncbi:MAG TPA: hypothetical protein VGO63_02025 [Candidatus Paceibacterota bacterium]|nr:hypothetical protein [Candidatus Paceibacterota bacterium]